MRSSDRAARAWARSDMSACSVMRLSCTSWGLSVLTRRFCASADALSPGALVLSPWCVNSMGSRTAKHYKVNCIHPRACSVAVCVPSVLTARCTPFYSHAFVFISCGSTHAHAHTHP